MIQVQRMFSMVILLLIPLAASGEFTKSKDGSKTTYESETGLYTLAFPTSWEVFPIEVIKKIQKETEDDFPVEMAIFLDMDEELYTCPCAWVGLFKPEDLPGNIPHDVRRGNLKELPLERAYGKDHAPDLGPDDENVFYDPELGVVWMRWENLEPEWGGPGYRELFVAVPTSVGVVVGIRFRSTPLMFNAFGATFYEIAASITLAEDTVWADYKRDISNNQALDAINLYREPALFGTFAFMVISALLGFKLRGGAFAFKLSAGALLTSLAVVVGCFPAILVMLDHEIPETGLEPLWAWGILGALLFPMLCVVVAPIFKTGRSLVGLTNAWMCGVGLVAFASCWWPYAYVWDLLLL